MNRKITPIFSLVFFSYLLTPNSVFAADGHADPHWTYEEQADWSVLKDPLYKPPFPYAECGIGQKQSPVNIDPGNVINVDKIDELQPSYIEVPLSLTNNGHTIRANIAEGALFFGNNQYDLVQFHFHAPSEHLLNGVTYPMEIHFVNGTADGRMAVVAVLIKAGTFNAAFQEILDQAPTQAGQTANPALLIRPDRLLPKHTQHFYTYAGSLTTPPCSEGVQWFILQELLEISEQQIKAFNSRFYHDNVRSEQKLNGRKLDVH
ncbi:carbonic anhydrase [Methylicorpusculum sp.]|uniref:carbonic anhydrase n=1 Tax=Methylicorpusculum sp. TaxID=2713644 RepID=UPI002725284A|nr:carbonic anhydrase family protein [Methylicorpusculum sp.]MDO8843175.1 carbonic anhydrase family protein [Methylicorpusculum sp.]